MADDHGGEETLKLKIGGTTIEIPERKAKREINRIRSQLREVLTKGQNYLDQLGLTGVIEEHAELLRASSSSVPATTPMTAPPSTTDTESLPAYHAVDTGATSTSPSPPTHQPDFTQHTLPSSPIDVSGSIVGTSGRRIRDGGVPSLAPIIPSARPAHHPTSSPAFLSQSANPPNRVPLQTPVASRPPPYSPRSSQSALNTDAITAEPVLDIPSTVNGSSGDAFFRRQSPVISLAGHPSRFQPRRTQSVDLPISRMEVPTAIAPDDTDTDLFSSERQQIMEPIPSHPFFRTTPRRMLTWASAAAALESELMSTTSYTQSPVALSPTDRGLPTSEAPQSQQENEKKPYVEPESEVFRRGSAYSVPGPSRSPISLGNIKVGAESILRAATSSTTRNTLMALVTNEAANVMGSLPNYDSAVQSCLQSESSFDAWVRHCQTVENGKQLADALLCTMQRMLDEPRPRLADDALQLLRRTMMKLSVKCQVIPSILFQHGAECYETLPRSGGSFGDVFHGTLAGKQVAMKRLRLFQVVDKDQYYKDLCREALLWRQLHHPFVLPFLGLDGNPSEGAVYMISPWMEHGSIPKYIQEHPNVSPRLKRIWISQAASGLSYLHDNGIIHGDLRGANILLDEHNYVHLADFGLAKIADAGKSTLGVSTWHSGAVRWMPPEVLKGGRCTFAGDVYSFASVCLEIVSEQYPFPQLMKDAQVIAWVSMGNNPEWADTRDPDLNEVGYFVTPAWSEDPEQRPQMKALRDSLAL